MRVPLLLSSWRCCSAGPDPRAPTGDQLLIRGSRLAGAGTAAPLPRIAARAGRRGASRRRRLVLAGVVVAALAAGGV